MKGYISKLAKHSGLLNPTSGSNLRSGGGGEKRLKTEPLHLDQTILTPSDNLQNESPKNVQNTALQSDTRSSNKSFSENRFVDNSAINDTFNTSDSKPSKPTDQTKSQLIRSTTDDFVTKNLSADDKSGAINSVPSKQFNQIEPTLEKKSVDSFSEKSVLSAKQVENVAIETESAQPEYFQKTNEMVESGTASPLEIQKILLREVQEWTSYSPRVQIVENAESTLDKTDVLREIVAPIEKNRNDLQDAIQTNAEHPELLNEQNFSLSIGNISITVEEPETKNQNENVSQNRTNTVNQTEKRPHSRLSRYYL